MISMLLSLVSGLIGWLTTVLPSSPFTGIQLALSGVSNAIGWLNWVIPVGQMATLYGVWLVAAAIWQVVQFVTSRFGKTLDAVTGKG